jgi:coenzyme F420 hydrogenase subunit beta
MSKRRDITEVVNNMLCHSCGSCFAACGHDCITYNTTSAGYLFPKIDYDACTNCGLCFDVCPGDHFTDRLQEKTIEDPFVGTILSSYVGKATNERIYKNSQSGGVVTAILKYLLESKQISAAIVTSMNMNSDSYSEARIVTTVNELIEAQKSKYVPTAINALMQEVEKIDGRVALVGLSCHMHGLENLLTIRRKLKNKIIKIGLICDRVMTSASVDFLSQKITNNKIKNFVFRDTLNTSYPGDITVTESTGKIKILDKKSRMIMKDYFTPARCLLCFDKMNIYADIVVGDPHGIQGVDRINGESLVLIRTESGKEILKKAVESNEILVRPLPVDKALQGQNIDAKRKKWDIHYKAWKEMGYKLPDYPKTVNLNTLNINSDNIDMAKKNLEHALSLDKYKSRDLLIKDANKYYKYKIVKENLLYPLRKIKSLINNWR